MSKIIKFSVSDENYNDLLLLAGKSSLQDYIRSVLFPNQCDDSITPEMAVKKALSKYNKGDTFTVPEIFGDEWCIPNGHAGLFGRHFDKLVRSLYSDRIKPTGRKVKKRKTYEII